MAKKTTSSKQLNSEVFDIDNIRQLIELMKDNDLSEIDLQQSEQRIKLRRGAEASASLPYYAPPAAPAPAAASAPAVAASTESAAVDDSKLIKSPIVGTFYAKPNPESPPYVKVGDTVSSDSIICTVEAMKMFTEIPAGISGKIVAVLVQDGEAVDVNKPLFQVE